MIYDLLPELEETDGTRVSPLSYVLLECAR